ncbi:hypothetical protein BH10CHL1_BH10CHL1_25190 [soil metagenome]
MSPTLLEGVAVLVVIGVAWQIGVRLAPDIMGMLQRAMDQLNSNYGNSSIKQPPKQNLTIDSSMKKEEFYDTEDHQPE